MENLFCDIDGITDVIHVNVSTSHSTPTASAIIECNDTSLDIGDEIEIDLGYVSSHGRIFSGYVKLIERAVPDNCYTITAYDRGVRLNDFYLVSANPASPLSFKNIKAEDLVEDLVDRAGIDDFYGQATSFTFGINNKFEVNLTSVYDYCRMVADTLSWHLYCDENGQINFVNRKPYVMTGDSGQPGDIADVPFASIYSNDGTGDRKCISFNYSLSEKDLRNKIVVYGRNNLYAEASAVSPYIPDNDDGSHFYKTTIVATPMIDTIGIAQLCANYNLQLYNRLTESGTVIIEGDYRFLARKVITVDERILGLTGNWYIFSADHSWGKEGYTTSLELRK